MLHTYGEGDNKFAAHNSNVEAAEVGGEGGGFGADEADEDGADVDGTQRVAEGEGQGGASGASTARAFFRVYLTLYTPLVPSAVQHYDFVFELKLFVQLNGAHRRICAGCSADRVAYRKIWYPHIICWRL